MQSTGIQTQVFILLWQAVYPLSHFPSPISQTLPNSRTLKKWSLLIHHLQSLSHQQPLIYNGLSWCGGIPAITCSVAAAWLLLVRLACLQVLHSQIQLTSHRKYLGRKPKSMLNIYRLSSFIINPWTIQYNKYSHCIRQCGIAHRSLRQETWKHTRLQSKALRERLTLNFTENHSRPILVYAPRLATQRDNVKSKKN